MMQIIGRWLSITNSLQEEYCGYLKKTPKLTAANYVYFFINDLILNKDLIYSLVIPKFFFTSVLK